MFWTEDVAAKCSGPQIINDSKTPSGRVHVGALRGVLIHDAIFRTLREKGLEARYLFGVDDYDPLDEIPAGKGEHFEKYLGQPLCNVPPPDNSPATDMAEHYIKEFFEIFEELGVQTEKYRMRDVYQSGRFNEVIDKILQNAAIVRRVYQEVREQSGGGQSTVDRSETWYPFQVICENCSRIATTEVFAYDGREVSYRCRPDKLVTTKIPTAHGCGHEGRVSPFDGRGKLPWKLEWVAKWVTFPVTIEGAGKDHSTRGGSRDVAAACLRAIFAQEPPLNVPYEFFLVGGAKMSSSRGVGAAARNMADLLPPELLRFLMIRTKPNSPVNFGEKEDLVKGISGGISEDAIVKLYNEFDRYQERATTGKATPDEACVYRLCELTPEGAYFNANFQLVSALVQMPHLDVVEQITRRKGAPLTDIERRHLDQRIASAKMWVEHYATEEEKTRLQETLPARAQELTAVQRAFLHHLAEALPSTPWDDDSLQAKIFEVARLTPIEQPVAFKAIYRVLLDREAGPKAGNLLAFLDATFVIPRFRELPFDTLEYRRQSATSPADFEKWLTQQREKIAGSTWTTAMEGNVAAFEIMFTMQDGKRQLKRVLVEGQPVDDFRSGLIAKLDLGHSGPAPSGSMA